MGGLVDFQRAKSKYWLLIGWHIMEISCGNGYEKAAKWVSRQIIKILASDWLANFVKEEPI